MSSLDAKSDSVVNKVAAVFPGQGSQHVGMAKDLYANFALVRQIFEEASDAISVDLKKLCFEGPESDLTLTENTQPSLLTASVAAFRVAEKELNFIPNAVAGHSLGEYSALVAIRCLDLTTAVRWVRERGAAMQKAVPAGEGTMAAILGIDDAQVVKLCERATANALEKRASGATDLSEITVPAIVEPANYNAPGQVVIAGSVDAVQEAIALVKAGEEFVGKAIPLQVSAPFHCKLMTSARDKMASLFSEAKASEKPKYPICEYIPNRTGRLSREPSLVFELLVEQVDHPVLWKQSITTLLDAQFTTTVEFGPGKVLSGLIKRIAAHNAKTCAMATMSDTTTLKHLEASLKTTHRP
jgi:[acyl-carrier-protein] S-malonyltransferase